MSKHRKTTRPWGSYTVLNTGRGFKVKLVEVLPKHRLSLQKHSFRSEHWVVVQGEAKIANGKSIFRLKENESTYIPKKITHRLENMTNKPLKIIEVQCGKILKETDIYRIADDHGRILK